MQSLARVSVLFVLLPIVGVAGQQRDATVPTAQPTGTAEISGVVLSAEGNASPLRRAVVTLTGGALIPRSLLSDDAGRFSFARLPAGTYTVVARKAAYLAAPYGAKRPGRAGMPVALADGQRSQINITMFRGAVITGILRDLAGQPVAGVDVRIIDARTLTTTDSAMPRITTTDDRGLFRIYGLPAGDYFVVALPSPGGRGEIVAPSTTSIDAAIASLTARRTGAPGSSTAPPSTPLRAITFAPVYYPGTPDHRNALRVHVDSGEERAGVDFELRPLAAAAIDGVVRGDVPDMKRIQVSLIPSGPQVSTRMSTNSVSGQPIDAQGRFRYTNLSPGSYRIVARASRGDVPPAAASSTTASGGTVSRPTTTTADSLFGFADVELNGEDVSGVAVILQPGGTISGRVEFKGAAAPPPPEELAKMTAALSFEGGTGMVSSGGLMMGNGIVGNPRERLRADGTFEIRGIGPGRFSFGLGSDAATPEWKLRSAVAAGRDLLDSVLELGPGTHIRDVVVTFTDAPTEISGTLQTGAGVLTTEYYIVAIPADRALWQPKSRRILSVRPATDGRFVFVDPPAGEYLIAALADLDSLDLQDVTFLEQIAPAGVKLSVAEGEKKVQDLRIR